MWSVILTSASINIIKWYKQEVDSIVKDKQLKRKQRNILECTGSDNFSYSIHGESAEYLINYFNSFDLPKLERKWGKLRAHI